MEWPPYCEIEYCKNIPDWHNREHDQFLCSFHCDNWDYPESPVYPAHSDKQSFYVGDEVFTVYGQGTIYQVSATDYTIVYSNGTSNEFRTLLAKDLRLAKS